MPTLAPEILSNDFRYNKGSIDSAAKTKVYTVAPGAEIDFQLAYGATMKHSGPLQIYMSKATGDIKVYDGPGGWFKVYQEGVCSDISGGLKNTDWCTWDRDTASFKFLRKLRQVSTLFALSTSVSTEASAGMQSSTSPALKSRSPPLDRDLLVL
ncbi:hypothetical protein ETB97_005633 [Aspergillus alliaceus]|uniref:AA9 family lytic polysaccharide monooxygenase n=1 Tax=Petromyces alliaceus TaxID=209559 RepID=A0A8H6E314_PETAA|nr:hypothetical protein ETB97_005633 [Aspergillus burnettii]